MKKHSQPRHIRAKYAIIRLCNLVHKLPEDTIEYKTFATVLAKTCKTMWDMNSKAPLKLHDILIIELLCQEMEESIQGDYNPEEYENPED
jgi:hypothetical protein